MSCHPPLGVIDWYLLVCAQSVGVPEEEEGDVRAVGVVLTETGF